MSKMEPKVQIVLIIFATIFDIVGILGLAFLGLMLVRKITINKTSH